MNWSGGILVVCLFLLGASATAIGLSNFFLGPTATANFFAIALDLAGLDAGPVRGLSNADADSEMRFYAVFWIAYGLAMLHIARGIDGSLRWVVLLLALFFLGGVGRLLSLVLVGPPHILFLILMWIELILPLVLGTLVFLSRRS
jgi:hypothetical protein